MEVTVENVMHYNSNELLCNGDKEIWSANAEGRERAFVNLKNQLPT